MRKNSFYTLRLTPEERNRLEALAQALGCKRSVALRMLLALARVEGMPSLELGELQRQGEKNHVVPK